MPFNVDDLKPMTEQEILLEMSFLRADIKNSESYNRQLVQEIAETSDAAWRCRRQARLAESEQRLEEQKKSWQFWLEQLKMLENAV